MNPPFKPGDKVRFLDTNDPRLRSDYVMSFSEPINFLDDETLTVKIVKYSDVNDETSFDTFYYCDAFEFTENQLFHEQLENLVK